MKKIHEATEFLEEITEQEIVIDINESGSNMEYTTPKVFDLLIDIARTSMTRINAVKVH